MRGGDAAMAAAMAARSAVVDGEGGERRWWRWQFSIRRATSRVLYLLLFFRGVVCGYEAGH